MTNTLPDEPENEAGAHPIWQRFQVQFNYPVYFVRDAFGDQGEVILKSLALLEPGKRHRCMVFADDGFLSAHPEMARKIAAFVQAHPENVDLVCPVIPVPGGEEIKSDPGNLTALSAHIERHDMDRHSFVIAIGGGAVQDAVGYAAAIAHRGLRHIRMPTTVLSQNDSGVGVKNAVNGFGKKNYFGTFSPPWAVINDLDFLRALPDCERRAGIAEAVKVALIRDGAFFLWLEQNADRLAAVKTAAGEYMIRQCARLHMNQIAHGGDPFELGSARPLDFGHWSAHKLESLTCHKLSHGNAVAIGIALDARYSVAAGLLPQGEERRILALLERLHLPTWHSALDQRTPAGNLAVLEGLSEFQEHLGGALTITLLKGCGAAVDVHTMDPEQVSAAIAWLKTHETSF